MTLDQWFQLIKSSYIFCELGIRVGGRIMVLIIVEDDFNAFTSHRSDLD